MKRRELKAQAKILLRGHWGKFALCTLVMVAVCVLLRGHSLFPEAQHTMQTNGFAFNLAFWNPMRPWIILVYIVCQILCMFCFYGYWDLFLKARVGSPTGVGTMCRRFASMPGKIVAATCINLIWTTAFSLVIVYLEKWFHVFAAPLILLVMFFLWVLTIRLSMVPIILLENPYTTVPNAFIQSYNLMRGNTWKLFLLDLSFIGWFLLSLLTFGVALLWILPYRYMTVLTFYYDTKARKLNQQEF